MKSLKWSSFEEALKLIPMMKHTTLSTLGVLTLSSLACSPATILTGPGKLSAQTLNNQAVISENYADIPIKLTNSGTSEVRLLEFEINGESFDLQDGAYTAGLQGNCDKNLLAGESCLLWALGSAQTGDYWVSYTPGDEVKSLGDSYDFAVPAPSGDPDTDFGGGLGYLLKDVLDDDEIVSVNLLSDEKLLAVGTSLLGTEGDISVARITSDGDLDASFGSGGLVTIDVATNSDDRAYDAQVLADDSVLIGGSVNDDAAVLKVGADGLLDFSFASSGLLNLDILGGASTSEVNSLIVDNSGDIFAVGEASLLSGKSDFYALKLSPSGVPSLLFGVTGIAQVGFGSNNEDIANTAVLLSNGSLIMAGSTQPGSGDKDSALVKLSSLGLVDITFGTLGKRTLDICGNNEDDEILSLIPTSNGKFLAVGYCSDGVDKNGFIARLKSNGALDTSFGDSSGFTPIDISGEDDVLSKLTSIAGGGFLATGYATVSGVEQMLTTRILSDGTLDSSFGTLGTLLTQPDGSSPTRVLDFVVNTTGKFFLGGFLGNSGDTDLCLIGLE